MSFDDYVKDMLNWEKYRSEHPACDNCSYYYEDEGQPCCKYWDDVCEDYTTDKCAQWR